MKKRLKSKRLSDEVLVYSLRAITGFLVVDPSNGGPLDHEDIESMVWAMREIADELRYRGYSLRRAEATIPYYPKKVMLYFME